MNQEISPSARSLARWKRAPIVVLLATLSNSLTADAALDVSIDPANITSADTFSLRALHAFGSSGYERLEQSITFDGNQVDVYVLMEAPYEIVLPVVTPDGAYFPNLDPLEPGTYRVDAEMWMRKPTFPGYQDVLFSTGSLTFNVLEPAQRDSGRRLQRRWRSQFGRLYGLARQSRIERESCC